jgi:hypothetical protein
VKKKNLSPNLSQFLGLNVSRVTRAPPSLVCFERSGYGPLDVTRDRLRGASEGHNPIEKKIPTHSRQKSENYTSH